MLIYKVCMVSKGLQIKLTIICLVFKQQACINAFYPNKVTKTVQLTAFQTRKKEPGSPTRWGQIMPTI